MPSVQRAVTWSAQRVPSHQIPAAGTAASAPVQPNATADAIAASRAPTTRMPIAPRDAEHFRAIDLIATGQATLTTARIGLIGSGRRRRRTAPLALRSLLRLLLLMLIEALLAGVAL